MPNYYAHLEFGRRVMDAMPLTLRRQVEREKDAFTLGLYGPDPLMFYHPFHQNRVKRLGHAIHRQSMRPVAERLRKAVEEGKPQATGYAAGLLCHFALDSACHAYIDAQAAQGAATHGALEAELDRALMLRVGLDPMRDTPIPPIQLPEAFDQTIPAVYPGVSARQFKSGYDLFCKASRLLTLAGGTRIRAWADRFAQRHPAFAGIRGMVLSREPDPACAASSQALSELLFAQIAPTVDALGGFFAAVERDAPLGDWYDRDFHGSPAETSEEALPRVPAAAGC